MPPVSRAEGDHGSEPEVVIVQRVLTHYRAPLFDALRAELRGRGIALRLMTGRPADEEAEKGDTVALPWSEPIQNRYLAVGDRNLVWQPFLRRVTSADLVIVEQASRLLANYPLLAWQRLGGPKVALWGHGRNFQTHAASAAGEWVKRRWTGAAHWWFAYNDLSATVLAELGLPSDRITSVQNAIDTSELRDLAADIAPADLDRARSSLGLRSRRVGVYVGGMYAEKRLPFLVDSADRIRSHLPDFELIALGGGPERGVLEGAAETRPWLHVLGPTFGRDKVVMLSLGRAMLMPGLVGLAILDAFTLGVPLITTDVDFHSPEIDYLDDGHNGVLVPSAQDADAYAAAVIRVLTDDALHDRLVEGCRAAAQRYTLEAMVERFANGIERALAAPRR